MKAKELQSLASPNGAYLWTVGGKVSVVDRYGASICQVKRITDGRGGTIYVGKVNLVGVEHETAFDVNGNSRGGDTWNHTHAEPINDEQANAIRLKNRAARIRGAMYKHNWHGLDDATSIAIHEALLKLNVDILKKD